MGLDGLTTKNTCHLNQAVGPLSVGQVRYTSKIYSFSRFGEIVIYQNFQISMM